MTRQQLDLLIRYINNKVKLTRPELQGSRAAHQLQDELVEIIAKLEESTDG